MTLEQLLAHLNAGKIVVGGSEEHLLMIQLAQDALRITTELNSAYHEPEAIPAIMERLTGRPVDPSFRMFPPFSTDCGKNTTFGKNVFINAGCRFQDQGGLTIGDGCQIGHNVVIATLNHDFHPDRRESIIPQPVVLERNVWVGSNSTILPGVTVGENAVIAAGAVVSKDVPANVIVGGVPAKVIRSLE